ncbi:hypothetical protein [Pseudomonas guariconensis]|nr:hypothetical protein [Pseudomonas guariconensis]MBH3360831.1 hypothetical protein [Pseudomonas guariconensis]
MAEPSRIKSNGKGKGNRNGNGNGNGKQADYLFWSALWERWFGAQAPT